MNKNLKAILMPTITTSLIFLIAGLLIGNRRGYERGVEDTKKDKTIINQTLNRGEMFKDGEGLPADYWTPGWGNYPGFINEQKNILRDICLYGEYSKFDTNYISPERANELLKLYSWEEE